MLKGITFVNVRAFSPDPILTTVFGHTSAVRNHFSTPRGRRRPSVRLNQTVPIPKGILIYSPMYPPKCLAQLFLGDETEWTDRSGPFRRQGPSFNLQMPNSDFCPCSAPKTLLGSPIGGSEMFSDLIERFMAARSRKEQEELLENLDWESLTQEERFEAGSLRRDLLDHVEELQIDE